MHKLCVTLWRHYIWYGPVEQCTLTSPIWLISTMRITNSWVKVSSICNLNNGSVFLNILCVKFRWNFRYARTSRTICGAFVSADIHHFNSISCWSCHSKLFTLFNLNCILTSYIVFRTEPCAYPAFCSPWWFSFWHFWSLHFGVFLTAY